MAVDVWVGLNADGKVLAAAAGDHSAEFKQEIGDMVLKGYTVKKVEGPVTLGAVIASERSEAVMREALKAVLETTDPYSDATEPIPSRWLIPHTLTARVRAALGVETK